MFVRTDCEPPFIVLHYPVVSWKIFTQSFICESPSKPLKHYENLTFEPFKSLFRRRSSGKECQKWRLSRVLASITAAVGLIMQKMPNKVFNVVNLTTSSAFLWEFPCPSYVPYLDAPLLCESWYLSAFPTANQNKTTTKAATSSSKEQS